MVEFKTLVLFASLNEESPKRISLKVGINFYQEYFLQNFEGWSRASFFHSNNWNGEGDSE